MAKAARREGRKARLKERKILMVDVTTAAIKLMASGQEGFRKAAANEKLTPSQLVKAVEAEVEGWTYDVISMGYPGIIREGRIAENPSHLGGGWTDFDFSKAFGCGVRFMNDAGMQALAHYEGGRLLFLTLGHRVGAALIADDTILPLQLGHMPLSKSEMLMERLGREGLKTNGKRRWQKSVERAVKLLQDIFRPDRFLIGGGNSKHLDPIPGGCSVGDEQSAFRGAVRLWEGADMLAKPRESTWLIEYAKASSTKKPWPH
jgi:predicted NBD/HSP70 family sugar kinase